MKKPILTLALIASIACVFAQQSISYGRWKLSYNDGIKLAHASGLIWENMLTRYVLDGVTIQSIDYAKRSFKREKLKDRFGNTYRWSIVYTDPKWPTMTQRFRLYRKYMLVDVELASDKMLHVNQIIPIVTSHVGPLISSINRRTLFVPFDNDAWIRYRSEFPVLEKLRSYEVTAVYHPATRDGLVIGAIKHDQWKNAIDLTHRNQSIEVVCGVADSLTRDSKPHGVVSAKKIRASTIFIGKFADWREGMESYADATATLNPRRTWNKAMPMGWNSWGALQFKVNYTNSSEVSAFFADELQPRSFVNQDGLTYIGLDSGWNSFSDKELKDFADQCHKCNQIPCIYWTPFTDWSKNPEKNVPCAASYKYKDIWLYANGKPQELDGAYAIDPTHPAVKLMMEETAARFRQLGYEYVKMDFMTHGRMEADHWYKRDIQTGTEAYNYGMQLLDSIFHDMYINLSISPIIPAQYAQSRRIACDAWNKIKDTEYTMNALSYGWWIGRVYSFNDADHVVLRDATEGENRARITSSVITGLYILGDDFSKSGNEMTKQKALKFLTNPQINKIATGRSFRPLTSGNERPDCFFIRKEKNGDIHIALFNYTDQTESISITPAQIGLENFGGYDVKELWSNTSVKLSLPIEVASKDVKVLLLKKRK